MVENFTVVIGTFGDEKWEQLARDRAIPSAESQAPVIHCHRATLAEARNAGLEAVKSEFTIHLDADDELEPGFVDAMATGTADLRVPSLRQVRNGRVGDPFMLRVWGHRHDCSGECLRHGNFAVIGTCVRTQLLRDVGGWEEWPWSEDWAAWARCWNAGGTLEIIPAAVYRAYVTPGSRNRRLTPEETNRIHRDIEAAIWPVDSADAA